MSFERTKGSIENLSGKNITADELLEMLVRVTQDVYENNQISKPSALSVDDQAGLLTHLYNLTMTMQAIYSNNQEGISQFRTLMQEKIRRATGELDDNRQVLAELTQEMEKEEAARSSLQHSLAETEKQRGHLLTVKEDCLTLCRRIDELNDSALDRMGEEKKQLEKDLAARETKAQNLNREQVALHRDLAEAQDRLNTVQSRVYTVRQELEALIASRQAAQAEVLRMEQEMEDVRQQLEEFRRQLRELPERNRERREAYQEAQAQLVVLRNAVNSAKNDLLLPGNLFRQDGSSLQVENHADLAVIRQEIGDWETLCLWFRDMEERINGMLEVYRSVLEAMVKKSESLTAQKS